MYTRTVDRHNHPTYYDHGKKVADAKTVDRLNKLAIPPAWREVKIAKSPRAKVQASGRDAAGRKQAIYSEAHRARQEKAKFNRVLQFALQLPELRKNLEKDLKRRKLDKQKVLATIVTLIDRAYFRVGNEQYAKENNTYGITTMRSKHMNMTATSVTFDFTGKSGQHHHKVIEDRTLVRILKQLDELPGYDVFRYVDENGSAVPLSSKDVNGYIRAHMGEDYSAKDFRTWGGTLIAASNLALLEWDHSLKERKKSITAAVKMVAKKLGNTPAVARSSYIDPSIIERYMNGDDIRKVYDTMTSMRPKKYLKREEQAVIKLLGTRT